MARWIVLGPLLVLLSLALRPAPARAETDPTNAPPAATHPVPVGPRRELLETGRWVFEQNCMVCHGRRGNGRGELARGMAPKPRDFTLGLFKFRSTPSGSLPTDDDLRRTIRGGLAGSAMPAFVHLAEPELRAVLEHLKSLSPRWTNAANYAATIAVPRPPDWFASAPDRARHAEAARPLFAQNCAPCHGTDGDGQGPSAASLLDVRGEPCPPRDLRTAPLRRGLEPADLHRLLVTGLDGSPMPSFAETTTAEERWDLVALILDRRPSSPMPR